jgi:hypothetical protein
MRSAHITRDDVSLEPPDYFPWNVGLYDDSLYQEDCGYIESVGAQSYHEAIALADSWVSYRDEIFRSIRLFGVHGITLEGGE